MFGISSMKFSLRQLQVFYLVSSHKSVSQAAKELDISQSAASMSLSQLEAQLDKPLFIRKGHKMELTNWGEWLRPHVFDMLQTSKRIEAGMQEMDLVSGRIVLGASQTPAMHMVPSLISKMDKAYPRLLIDLGVENTEHVIEGLLDYRFDVGLIEGHCDDERIERQLWCNDELVIIAGVNNPLSQMDEVLPEQLSEALWVVREPGAGTREIFDLHIHKVVDQVQVHREYDHVDVILEMVKNSDYLGCLSRRSVNAWVEAGHLKILNVPELKMGRHFSFIWRKNEVASPSREAIIDMANELVTGESD